MEAIDKKRSSKPTAGQRLLAHAERYSFYVAVSMLERLTPEAVRIGGDGPYAGEAIRFRHDHDLIFNPSDVRKVAHVEKPRTPEQRLEQSEKRYEVTTAFMGVTGSMTPMPLYLAEEICQDDEGARMQRDFLDMFHHRLVSLVYRITQKFDFPREYTSRADDQWSKRMLALAGLDSYERWQLKHISRQQMLRLSPLMASRVRSARTLSVAIADIAREALDGAKVEVVQFTGDWTGLDPEQRISLGIENTVLGESTVLGVQVFHRASKATIVVGPLRENFRRFLADGDMFPVICELVGVLSPEPVEYELELVLVDRPPFMLGKKEGGRIGFDSWLSSQAGQTAPTHLKVPLPTDLLSVSRKKVGVGSLAPSASR